MLSRSLHLRRLGSSRAGKVIILFGALCPVLVGGMALSVDSGVKATARAQMQTAADAAALAGARQIGLYRQPATLNSMLVEARKAARNIGQSNQILKTNVVIQDNTSNLANGEVVLGHYDKSLDAFKSTAVIPDTTRPLKDFNAVKVLVHRDKLHGGAVPGFFGGVLGFGKSNMRISSVAVLEAYEAKGFASTTQSANLLPIVLDKPTYDAMIAGSTTDQYTWNESSKTVSDGGDGIAESKLYPVKNGNPGNWGTVKIGVSNNSTSTLGAQIRYGITPAQLATYPNSTVSLNTSLSPPSITLEGNPGISAGIKDDLTSIIGKPVFIPIYDQTGGNGNNAWYRVIKFAGVRILSVEFKGNPKYVIIQPAQVDDPTGIPGTIQPLDSGGLLRLRLVR